MLDSDTQSPENLNAFKSKVLRSIQPKSNSALTLKVYNCLQHCDLL